MEFTNIPQTLDLIRNASSTEEQLKLLKDVKNDLIGNLAKKEQWVQRGILDAIKNVMGRNKSAAKEITQVSSSVENEPSLDDNITIQAIQIITTFTSAGPQFLDPLYHSGLFTTISSYIHATSQHSQVVLVALQALVSATDALRLASTTCALTTVGLSAIVFQEVPLETFRKLLLLTPAYYTHVHANHAATLLARLILDNKLRAHLAKAGIIDALATRLASFAVAEDLAVPGSKEASLQYGLDAYYPRPENRVKIALILEALINLIGTSKYLACMVIYSPAILAVFPAIPFDPPSDVKEAWESVVPSVDHTEPLGAIDFALPPLAPHFDGLFRTSKASRSKVRLGPKEAASLKEPEQESPLVPFLILLCRSRKSPLERLMAIWVLAALFKAGCGMKKVRESSIGLLVIPVLMEIMRQYSSPKWKKSSPDARAKEAWQIIETAPLVLGRLIRDNSVLQRASFNCNAIPLLVHSLEKAYEPCEVVQTKRWSPTPVVEMDVDSLAPSCRLGDKGQAPEVAHNIRTRESALKAVACLAADTESYREKLLEEHPVIPFVSESLYMFPAKPVSKDRPKDRIEDSMRALDVSFGINPPQVIEAACNVVRVLSRSIRMLRTTLVDFAVHKPIAALIRSSDTRLAIAASSAVCNLLVEASPMRQPLVEQCNIVPALADLTHSENPELRLNAMWALKHLVDFSSIKVKKQALNAIEPGWLTHMICDDTQDNSLVDAQLAKAGRADEDVDMTAEDHEDVESTGELLHFGPARAELGGIGGSSIPFLNDHEKLLELVMDSDFDPMRKARSRDLGIQEQSLGFIRNFIGVSASASIPLGARETAEMAEVILSMFGRSGFFEMLNSKLEPRCLRPFLRRNTGDAAVAPEAKSRMLYPQPSIITSVVYILVHMSASASPYRDLIVEQEALHKALLPCMHSPDSEVRLSICSLLANLSCWEDGMMEVQPREERARRLRNLGYLEKLRDIEASDVHVAVKEKAKMAYHNISMALQGYGGSSGGGATASGGSSSSTTGATGSGATGATGATGSGAAGTGATTGRS